MKDDPFEPYSIIESDDQDLFAVRYGDHGSLKVRTGPDPFEQPDPERAPADEFELAGEQQRPDMGDKFSQSHGATSSADALLAHLRQSLSEQEETAHRQALPLNAIIQCNSEGGWVVWLPWNAGSMVPVGQAASYGEALQLLENYKEKK